MKVADCIGDHEDLKKSSKNFKKSSKNIERKTKNPIIVLTLPYQSEKPFTLQIMWKKKKALLNDMYTPQ